MTGINQSLLKPISIGYVCENKTRDSKEIEVYLSEVNPFASGEIVGGYNTLTVDGITTDGGAQTFTVKASNSIMAAWLGDGTNRISAPDVRRGEKVQVHQYGNTDKYYWTAYNEPGVNTRKRETVINAISNTTDEKQTELNADNSWFFEMSTHDKIVVLKTNKADGEKWAYTVQIDVKNGNVAIADDLGNYFQISSPEESIELGTQSGGLVSLVKRVLTFDVDDWIVNAKTANWKISETKWEGSQAAVQVGNSTWKGNMAMTGTFSSGGGAATFSGATDFTSSVSHNGKSIGVDHQHGGVQGGPSNTSGIV